MISTREIKAILQKNKSDIEKQFDVKKIGLFGSFSREEQCESSDIDILVEFKSPVSMFKFIDLEMTLENLLGIKVDLVTPKALKPVIGHQILSEVIYI